MVPLLITSKSSCVNSFWALCCFFFNMQIGVCVCVCVWTSPCFASRLHVIGQCDIVWPHVKLPLPQSQHATVDTPTVNAYAHVNVDPRHLPHQPAGTQHRRSASITSNKLTPNQTAHICKHCFYSRDGLYHVDAHLHTAVGVVGPGLRQPGHTIITITQNFNT